MLKDGTQSWMVSRRSVGKYVTELSEENKKPIHYEEASSRTGETCCDGTKKTTFTVLIFVINLTDQTTKVEGHTRRSEGY